MKIANVLLTNIHEFSSNLRLFTAALPYSFIIHRQLSTVSDLLVTPHACIEHHEMPWAIHRFQHPPQGEVMVKWWQMRLDIKRNGGMRYMYKYHIYIYIHPTTCWCAKNYFLDVFWLPTTNKHGQFAINMVHTTDIGDTAKLVIFWRDGEFVSTHLKNGSQRVK